MSSSPAQEPVAPVIRAYLEPIRTVFLLDDQYPTFAEDSANAREKSRARELWRACVGRGWLCDVGNRTERDSEKWLRRVETADLILLDYELKERDPEDSLLLLRHLARSPTPNLVLLYTQERDLDRVRRAVAATLRDPDLDEALLDLDGGRWDDIIDAARYEISADDLDHFLEGRRGTTADLREALEGEGVPPRCQAPGAWDRGRATI
ncbi:MAG: response regulator receiver domain [Pseudomonadota bacterium]